METIKTIRRFPSGVVTPPPSKSLLHRAVICAALATRYGGESVIRGAASSEDIAATIGGLRALGYGLRQEGDCVFASGAAPATGSVDCGESGSTLRFLVPVAALDHAVVRFTGRGRLLQRPMDAYLQAGVPMKISGDHIITEGGLSGGTYRLPGDVSSQFVTGLLLTLPILESDSEIILSSPLESRPYVDMTIDVLSRFGVEILRPAADRFHIPGGQRFRGAEYTTEGDYSQGAVFLAAAALGCPVACKGLRRDSLQGDRAILDTLAAMGVRVSERDGLLTAHAKRLRGTDIDVREIPDLTPPLAALACFCHGVTHITGAARLRLKESDRLHALATELGKLGADIRELPDGLVVHGKPSITGGAVDAWNDHRIAMALALAAIRCDGPVTLTGADCVNKSYPAFWQDFEREERHG